MALIFIIQRWIKTHGGKLGNIFKYAQTTDNPRYIDTHHVHKKKHYF